MARITSPCKDCQDRVLHCHSHCLRYAEFKAASDRQKERVYAAKEHEKMVMDFVCNQAARTRQAEQAYYRVRKQNLIKEVKE